MNEWLYIIRYMTTLAVFVDWVDRVVQAREARKWSARELARRMGLSHSTIAGWEQRRVANLSMEAVRGLAQAFGVRQQTMSAYLSGELELERLAADQLPPAVEIDPSLAMYASLMGKLSPKRRQEVTDFLLKMTDDELRERGGDD